jgi:hypothetical protein
LHGMTQNDGSEPAADRPRQVRPGLVGAKSSRGAASRGLNARELPDRPAVRDGAPGRHVPRHQRAAVPRSPESMLVTRTGLRFPDSLEYEPWKLAGEHVTRLVESSSWCLGDWILYGEKNFKDRYRDAVEAAGIDYQTLRNYTWVARRFPLSRRRDTLSFQHHAEVAAMGSDDQDNWLDRAEQNSWSRNRLRQEIRRSRQQQRPLPELRTLPRLRVANQKVDRWRAAADRQQVTLENWIVQNLDLIADSSLAAPHPTRTEQAS